MLPLLPCSVLGLAVVIASMGDPVAKHTVSGSEVGQSIAQDMRHASEMVRSFRRPLVRVRSTEAVSRVVSAGYTCASGTDLIDVVWSANAGSSTTRNHYGSCSASVTLVRSGSGTCHTTTIAYAAPSLVICRTRSA